MVLNQERIGFTRVVIGGVHDPALDGSAVYGGFVPDLFYLAQVALPQQALVEAGDAAWRIRPLV